jgi:hypothetical protein
MHIFILALLLLQSAGTIKTIPEEFVPANRLIDVHAIRVVFYRPKDCRVSNDPARTLNGTLSVRECRRAIFEFGALKAPRRAVEQDSDWQQPSNVMNAVTAFQTPRKDVVTVHYSPKYCKPLGDRYDRYVCGSEKGKYGVYFVHNQ